MKRKAGFILVLALILSLVMATAAFAESKTIVLKIGDPNMTVNGISQEIDPGRGTKALIIKDRTLVPIRAIIENMGGTIAWDDILKQVTISAAGKDIKLVIGDNTAQLKSQSSADTWAKVTMDVPAQVINSRTMVPIRFVSENLGAKVDWAANTKTITITLAVTAFDALNWAGTWETDTGTLILNQTGNVVVGNCDYWGQIKGSASGNQFVGKWKISVDNQGDLELTLSEDGKSFTGKWRYNYPGNTDEEWSEGVIGQR